MFDILGSVEGLLINFGYFALFGMVFAESGLFFGFFFPGDSLLFAAGLLASKGYFDIWVVLAGVMVCAVAGDQAGYWMGKKYGRGFFNKPDSLFFNPKHIEDAEGFYARHGKKTIVLARFVPAVRTFAPIAAGIAKMDYATFALYNVLGGVLWALVFVPAGFFLGSVLPNAGEVMTIVILLIIILSFVPIALEFLKRMKKQ